MAVPLICLIHVPVKVMPLFESCHMPYKLEIFLVCEDLGIDSDSKTPSRSKNLNPEMAIMLTWY